MSEDEIVSGLRGEGVSHIRRLTTLRDGQRRDTSVLVLTFDNTTLPEKINIGWLSKDVRAYILNPLRCLNARDSVTEAPRVVSLPAARSMARPARGLRLLQARHVSQLWQC